MSSEVREVQMELERDPVAVVTLRYAFRHDWATVALNAHCPTPIATTIRLYRGAKRRQVRQRILATGVFVAGLCEAGGPRWAGVTDLVVLHIFCVRCAGPK